MAVIIHSPVEQLHAISLPLHRAAGRTATVSAAEMAAVERAMDTVLREIEATPARDAVRYHMETGGGRLRARLAIASGLTWNTPAHHRIAAAVACELVHNASLIHDDLSDADTLRRGHATVWHRYGPDIALCAGDLLLTCAFHLGAAMDDAPASQALLRQLSAHANRVIGGQSLELAARRDALVPTMREYARATRAKTAPLIELPLAAGAVPGRMPAALTPVLRPLAEAIGLAYQILDDLDDAAELKSDGETGSPHPLHALHHHRPPARAPVAPGEIRHRCLRHARAALTRARRLSRAFPPPLEPALREVIDHLSAKADGHTRAADAPHREDL